MIIADEQIEAARAALPELPAARRARFIADFGVTEYDAHVLTLSREMADFYEAVVAAAGGAKQGKVSANWVMGEFSGALNKAGLDLADSPVTAEQLGGMIARIIDNTISGKIAKQVFGFMWESEGKSADDIIAEKGLKQEETDTGAIEAIIKKCLQPMRKWLKSTSLVKKKPLTVLLVKS